LKTAQNKKQILNTHYFINSPENCRAAEFQTNTYQPTVHIKHFQRVIQLILPITAQKQLTKVFLTDFFHEF